MSMSYTDLADFIENRMRMSHIYQPVMLIALLQHQGKCSQEEIARSLLAHDQSQIEYYTRITNNMVGRVLRRHGIVRKEKKEYSLVGFDELSEAEVEDLVERCQRKRDEYIESRGNRIWSHRTKSGGYISGTLRYEVLKRAKFHCELCGIPADQKALEVDHIIPRNQGGSDDLSNLQALCYSCNAMKRGRDDTDFRAVRESFKKRQKGCGFCEITDDRIIAQDELAYVILDPYALIVPKRHVSAYFDLGQAEINACHRLMDEVRDDGIDHVEILINSGVSEDIMYHCCIHLIPSRVEDSAAG